MIDLNTTGGWHRPVRQIILGEVRPNQDDEFVPAILMLGDPLKFVRTDRLIMAVNKETGIAFTKIHEYRIVSPSEAITNGEEALTRLGDNEDRPNGSPIP